jgi:hypothetical protein
MPFDPISLSKATSGGYASYVDMVTGQAQPSPGPRVWFQKRDPETGEMVGEATIYTVRFGVNPTTTGDTTALATTYRCVATIRWKVAGQVITRQMDVGQGAAISGACEGVDIDLQDMTPTDPDAPLNIPYRVVVQVVRGGRTNYFTPATLAAATDIVNSLASTQVGAVQIAAAGVPDGNARYPIPPNAGVYSVEVTVGPTGNTNPISLVCVAGAGSYEAKIWNPLVNIGFVLLPSNATYVEVINQGLDPVEITLTWGVEG